LTIDLLLQRGADVHQKDSGGNTLLVGAVNCPLEVVQKLVDAGVSVSATGSTHFSPLQLAFVQGRWDIAEFLVSRGARVSKKAIDEVFFEKPTDPKKLALIRRATEK
jgi:ankyrin repeat protein